jgi:diguanylate cyclase (GGDEF)-like protein
MRFDVHTFWLVGAIFAYGSGLLMLIVRREYPEYLSRVLLYVGAGGLALGTGWTILALDQGSGNLFLRITSRSLVALCLSLEYRAVTELKRQPVPIGWVAAPPALAASSCIFFSLIWHNLSAEIFIFRVLLLAMTVLLAQALLRAEDRQRHLVDLLGSVAFLFLAVCVFVVLTQFIRAGAFTEEYDFNRPGTVYLILANILTNGIFFTIFPLMVSERLNREMKTKAMHDSLTGLYNRRAFEEIAAHELSGCARTGLPVSLLLFDLDHFKQINDTFGHAAGDSVLRAAAATFQISLREEEFLCRWGGDEFCALLPHATSEQAQVAAERILHAIRKLNLPLGRKTVKLSVSIGVATDRGDLSDLASLMKLADSALYRAKETGRNRFACAWDRPPAKQKFLRKQPQAVTHFAIEEAGRQSQGTLPTRRPD